MLTISQPLPLVLHGCSVQLLHCEDVVTIEESVLLKLVAKVGITHVVVFLGNKMLYR